MNAAGAARYPGTKGRIPNFVGAEEAAERLASERVFQRAQVIKINSDTPQLPVRQIALTQGKTLIMAVPNLRDEKCFWLVNPAGIPRANIDRAATIDGAALFGQPLHPDDVPAIDLVICGSVAVDVSGGRVGKGGGFADLEYALLRERDLISVKTPVATTVHPLQIQRDAVPMTIHDVPVDLIATPDNVVLTHTAHGRPAGLYAEELTRERWEELPILRSRFPDGPGDGPIDGVGQGHARGLR